MDEKCGAKFKEATDVNETLIDFEFGFNNFSLHDVCKHSSSNIFAFRSDQSKIISRETKESMMKNVSESGESVNLCTMRMSDSRISTLRSNQEKNKKEWRKRPENSENRSLMRNGESTSSIVRLKSNNSFNS